MAILRSIGNRLFTQEQAQFLENSGLLTRLLDPKDGLTSIDVAGAPLTMEAASAPTAPRDQPPPVPIKLGNPLSIALDYIYTGHYPIGWGRIGRPDLLVTSAVRAPHKSKAASKALNLLKHGVERNEYYSVGAGDDGATVIYHTPALTDGELLVDIDLAVEHVDEEAFDQVSGLLSGAAALPIFVGYGAYLLAGSVVVKLVGRLAEMLFDRGPWLTDSERLFIETRPGANRAYGPILFCRGEDEHELTSLTITPEGRLLHPNGREYRGQAPFATAFLDGRERPELKDFAPSAALIETLDRFYRIQGHASEPTNVLLDAFKLYNDFEARRKIDDLEATLKTIDDETKPEYKRLEQLREAWLKKIQNPIFRPGATLPAAQAEAPAAEEASAIPPQEVDRPQRVDSLYEVYWSSTARATRRREVPLFKLSERAGFFHRGSMQIDVDGSPRAYSLGNRNPQRLDDLSSADGQGGSSTYVQGQRYGNTVAHGPRPGFYVSATSLRRHQDRMWDCDNFVDAEVIPYFVHPVGRNGMKLGDVGIIVHVTTLNWTPAIFGDSNDARRVSETSLRVAVNLGLSRINPTTLQVSGLSARNGDDHQNYFYLYFPDSAVTPAEQPPYWPEASIREIAEAKFAAWGGIDMVHQCLRQI
jgi:hypothetical protein